MTDTIATAQVADEARLIPCETLSTALEDQNVAVGVGDLNPGVAVAQEVVVRVDELIAQLSEIVDCEDASGARSWSCPSSTQS